LCNKYSNRHKLGNALRTEFADVYSNCTKGEINTFRIIQQIARYLQAKWLNLSIWKVTMMRKVLNPHWRGFYIIILSTPWMNTINIQRIKECKLEGLNFWYITFSMFLELNTIFWLLFSDNIIDNLCNKFFNLCNLCFIMVIEYFNNCTLDRYF
jgi:hypothetical protein